MENYRALHETQMDTYELMQVYHSAKNFVYNTMVKRNCMSLHVKMKI